MKEYDSKKELCQNKLRVYLFSLKPFLGQFDSRFAKQGFRMPGINIAYLSQNMHLTI